MKKNQACTQKYITTMTLPMRYFAYKARCILKNTNCFASDSKESFRVLIWGQTNCVSLTNIYTIVSPQFNPHILLPYSQKIRIYFRKKGRKQAEGHLQANFIKNNLHILFNFTLSINLSYHVT